jgi:site-specific DNA recombinase
MKKAIGYIRVSTEKQAEEGVSLDAQKEKIRAWCDMHDYELVAIEEDAGVSGKSMKKREGLRQALARVEKGTALVAYSFSRLARSTRDLLDIADILQKRDADLVSISERIDTSGATGRLVFTILAALAQFERELIGERTKSSLDHKKRVGEAYSPTPFGFDRVERDGEGEKARLVVNEDEVRLLEQMKTMKEEGASLRGIASMLNACGVKPKRGAKWHASSVKKMLERPD